MIVSKYVAKGLTLTKMKSAVVQFLSNFSELDESERNLIAEKLTFKEFSKGSVLVEAGSVPQACYFVLKGCIRQYHVDSEGNERTTAIYAEDDGAVSSNDYVNQSASKSHLVCVEDTLVLLGNPEKDEAMYAEFPKLREITNSMIEQNLGKTKEDFANFVSSSPEDRYLSLLEKRPHLFNRVPLHQLASLIGITPESMSRIRKRLVKK